MLLFNNYNRDAENAAYVQACMEQRERLNVTVKEAEIMTVEELEKVLDYESDIEDRLDWARGGW